jgi:hypothetical protein
MMTSLIRVSLGEIASGSALAPIDQLALDLGHVEEQTTAGP